MKSFLLCTLSLFFISPAFTQSKKAKELVSKMTLEEKAKLVVGMGMRFPGMPQNNTPMVGQSMDKVPGAAGSTFAIQHLGIPNTVVADGPAGLRIEPIRDKDSSKTFYATAFPIGTLLASTWDTVLVKKVGQAMGSEVKEYGIDIILGPALNLHRNPLGGRNFEYYSEDPVVTGTIAAAMVNGIESNGVGTSIKHFAANNQETNRNTINTIVSERALREIYLKGFEICVKKSQPWTVMSSYNQINTKYASEDYDLLTTILRKEWGFKGYVMTDWFGGVDAVAQMKAGNDLLMPGSAAQTKSILDAVNSGSLDVKILDENAARIVDIILISPSYNKYAFTNKPDLKAHANITRMAAADGMILLKNENSALPVSKNIKNIAAFGNTSYDFYSGGTGSGDVNEAYTVSLGEGLSNAGYKIDEEVKTVYSSYLAEEKRKHPKKSFFEEFMNPTPPPAELSINDVLITKKAAEADVALITVGRNAGEGKDRSVETVFKLSDIEQALIKKVSSAFHAKNKKVIVILNVDGVIDVASWRDNADAILLAWQGGQEGGNAVADIVSGKVTPSGKLATTFPMKYEDVPSAKNFPGKEYPEKATGSGFMRRVPAEVTYEEGIYVGYRYYNTFDVKPAYPFGYGLSYTNFTYSNLKLSSSNYSGKITATIEITNTGKTAGKEVVQLYIASPSNKMDKPSEELKGFAKTNLLKPGEKQTITFTIDAKDMASFDTNTTSWVAEAGNYTVKVGASSTDTRQTASFHLDKDIITEKCNKVMSPQVQVNEMSNKKAF